MMPAESETRPLVPPASSREGSVASDPYDSPLILVVDDDPMNHLVMNAVLRRLGYRSHTAKNGREAVEATQRQAYDAVLMDCLMPEMDGYQATAAIRRYERERRSSGARRRLPIIAVTAVAIQGAREKCIESGMDDYLSKPVVVQSVADLLERWVAGSGEDASWLPEQAEADDEPDDAPIDMQSIEALRQLDPDAGDSFIAEIVRDFKAEVSTRFDLMRMAVANGDMQAIVQELHFIAGCSSLVGARRVESLARSLEGVTWPDAASGLKEASGLVARLDDAFARAQSALDSLVA